MRDIHGYLCVTGRDEGEPLNMLFGMNSVGEIGLPYQTFETNGLRTFGNREEAKLAQKELKRMKEFPFVHIHYLRMSIADSIEEQEDLFPAPFVIVVGESNDEERPLYGPKTEDRTPFGYCGLQYNRLTPFPSMQELRRQQGEVGRHCERAARAATWSLIRVKG